tara:strand:- start:1324 stop:1893 length:570 start_codon:yes stop_codon:yes gene_type:complete
MVNKNNFNISGNNLEISRISGTSFGYPKYNTNNNNSDNNMINHIKKNIISDIIIHYYRKDFDQLKNHLLLKENYINQINILCKNNLQLKNDFQPYIILMDALEKYMNTLKTMEYLEETNIKKKKNQINNMFYELGELKIKTEFEVYNIIFGKPNIKNNEKYDQIKLIRIKKLLETPTMTFNTIEKLLKK